MFFSSYTLTRSFFKMFPEQSPWIDELMREILKVKKAFWGEWTNENIWLKKTSFQYLKTFKTIWTIIVSVNKQIKDTNIDLSSNPIHLLTGKQEEFLISRNCPHLLIR